MKLSPPKAVTWWIAFIAGTLGILMHQDIVKIAYINGYSFWFSAGAFILLALATLFKGL